MEDAQIQRQEQQHNDDKTSPVKGREFGLVRHGEEAPGWATRRRRRRRRVFSLNRTGSEANLGNSGKLAGGVGFDPGNSWRYARAVTAFSMTRSEEHTSELQSHSFL